MCMIINLHSATRILTYVQGFNWKFYNVHVMLYRTTREATYVSENATEQWK